MRASRRPSHCCWWQTRIRVRQLRNDCGMRNLPALTRRREHALSPERQELGARSGDTVLTDTVVDHVASRSECPLVQ